MWIEDENENQIAANSTGAQEVDSIRWVNSIYSIGINGNQIIRRYNCLNTNLVNV